MGVANLQGSCFMTVISITMERLLWGVANLPGSCFMTVINVTMERLLWGLPICRGPALWLLLVLLWRDCYGSCQSAGVLLYDCY